MTDQADYRLTRLCLWREARGEGKAGMEAVASILRNRVLKRASSFAREVMRPWQFTSMTNPKDSQFALQPGDADPSAIAAGEIAAAAIAGTLADPTHGSTLYWNPRGLADREKAAEKYQLPNGQLVDFPHTWNRHAVAFAAVIGRHIFLREL